MKTGVVKWFNSKRGIGFIVSDDDEMDYFVHYSGIIAEGFKSLHNGAKVSFRLHNTDDGRVHAVDVKEI